GTRSTWYSAPRYTSVCPRCLPYPLASVTVRPCTPNACKAAFTSSSLNGLMTAVISFIWVCPFGVLYRPSDAEVSPDLSACVGKVKQRGYLLQTYFAGGHDTGQGGRRRVLRRRRPAGQAPSGRSGSGSAEDGVHERGRVEWRQVIRALAEADQLDRHAELALHGDDDAALGGAVELGEHDAGDVDRLGEDPALPEPVLPGGRVQPEQPLPHRGPFFSA